MIHNDSLLNEMQVARKHWDDHRPVCAARNKASHFTEVGTPTFFSAIALIASN